MKGHLIRALVLLTLLLAVTMKGTVTQEPTLMAPQSSCCGYPPIQYNTSIPCTISGKPHTGNCTWWAAYARPDLARDTPTNAGNWAPTAIAKGYPVNPTPQVGDIYENPGHVRYVVGVERDAQGRQQVRFSHMAPSSFECMQEWGPENVASDGKFIHCKGNPGVPTADWHFGECSFGWIAGPSGGFSSKAVANDSQWILDPAADPQIIGPWISVSAGQYNSIEILMANNAQNVNGQIFFVNSIGEGFSEAKSVGFTTINDGGWRTYRVRMDGNPYWSGTIARLRIDPVGGGNSNGSYDAIGIDQVRFINIDPTSPPTMEEFGGRLYQAYRGLDNSVYTRYTTDGSNWSSSVKNGMTLSSVEMAVFDPGSGARLYQAIRGTDDGIYTRYTIDGNNWTNWVKDGATLSNVSMVVFNPGSGARLYQAVRGTDNGLYIRYTTNGDNWTGWTGNGSTLSGVSMTVFNPGSGARLYQAARDLDSGINTRYTTDGNNWTGWVKNGSTLSSVSMIVYAPPPLRSARLYQAVRGTNNGVYTRYTTDGENWAGWVENGATLSEVSMQLYPRLAMLQSVRGIDGGVYNRFTALSDVWSDWWRDGETASSIGMEQFWTANPCGGFPPTVRGLYQSFQGANGSIYTRVYKNSCGHFSDPDVGPGSGTVGSEAVSEDGRIRVRITGSDGPIGSFGVEYVNLYDQNTDRPGLPISTALVMIGNYDIQVTDMNGNPITVTQDITAELSIASPSSVKPNSPQVFFFNPDVQSWESFEAITSTSDFVTVQIHHFSQYAVLRQLETVYMPLILRNY